MHSFNLHTKAPFSPFFDSPSPAFFGRSILSKTSSPPCFRTCNAQVRVFAFKSIGNLIASLQCKMVQQQQILLQARTSDSSALGYPYFVPTHEKSNSQLLLPFGSPHSIGT
jgi:hypothetical protein